jgi:hypothetical protein
MLTFSKVFPPSVERFNSKTGIQTVLSSPGSV